MQIILSIFFFRLNNVEHPIFQKMLNWDPLSISFSLRLIGNTMRNCLSPMTASPNQITRTGKIWFKIRSAFVSLAHIKCFFFNRLQQRSFHALVVSAAIDWMDPFDRDTEINRFLCVKTQSKVWVNVSSCRRHHRTPKKLLKTSKFTLFIVLLTFFVFVLK